MLLSIVSPTNSFLLLGIILLAVTFGIVMEKYTKIGAKMSGVIVSLFILMICSNLGLIPIYPENPEVGIPVYDFINSYLVTLAVPLLLFNANLIKIFKESGRLLLAFLIGSFGTVVGGLVALFLLNVGGDEAWKVMSVFIATYIGGSMNFAATAQIVELSADIKSVCLAVDNGFTNIYMAMLFVLPAFKWLSNYFPAMEDDDETQESSSQEKNYYFGIDSLVYSLTIAVVFCFVGNVLGEWTMAYFNSRMNLSILYVTFLTVLMVNIFPHFLVKLEHTASVIGMFFLTLFLAVIGAQTDLITAVEKGTMVIAFAFIVLVVHFIVTFGIGRLFKLSIKELGLASMANITGAPLMAPLATSYKMKSAIVPGILVAILGYAIGTFVAVGIGILVR